jgi:hypothetical protein
MVSQYAFASASYLEEESLQSVEIWGCFGLVDLHFKSDCISLGHMDLIDINTLPSEHGTGHKHRR